MEFIIDTVDLKEIKEAVEYLPITGVTSNPSIVKKSNPAHFFNYMREIRSIIGMERSLHIQMIAQDCEGIVREAHHTLQEIDEEVYIKIPVTYEGVKAIKHLKQEGHHVTATAVYDIMQAYMGLCAGADYIAPYVNRISNLGNDPMALISELAQRIARDGYDCKIVGASFKNVRQLRDAFQYGADAITATADIFAIIFNNPSIDKAVTDFGKDWESMYGVGRGLCDV